MPSVEWQQYSQRLQAAHGPSVHVKTPSDIVSISTNVQTPIYLPQLITLLSWKTVVFTQLLSNFSQAKVEEEWKEQTQDNGTTKAVPQRHLASQSHGRRCCCCTEDLPQGGCVCGLS